jgi:hypothetical protein
VFYFYKLLLRYLQTWIKKVFVSLKRNNFNIAIKENRIRLPGY